MGISENFLVNTKSFDPIIDALISKSKDPEKITDELLEEMGFDNPSDLLVLHVLRGMEIIDQDRNPTDLYYRMVDPDQTKDAIAEGIINGYSELFEQNFDAHKILPGELKEELSTYFDGKKTDLIIKYITNTFHKLVSYAGFRKVEQARDNHFKTDDISSKTIKSASENGISSTLSREAEHNNNIKTRSIEDILFSSSQSEQPGEIDQPEDPQPHDGAENEDHDEDVVEYNKDSDFEDSDMDSNSDEFGLEPESAPTPGVLSLSKLDNSNPRVQKAVIKRAELQYKLDRFEDALDSYGYILAHFDDYDQQLLKDAVSNAVIRRVEILKELNRDHELLAALNEVISKFSKSDNKQYFNRASEAYLDKAEILEKNKAETKTLLPLYKTIVERLSDTEEPALKERVDKIYIKRLGLLIRSDNQPELLTALEEFIPRFMSLSKYRKFLEEAMFRKAELMETMNLNEEALKAYSSFLEEFDGESEL